MSPTAARTDANPPVPLTLCFARQLLLDHPDMRGLSNAFVRSVRRTRGDAKRGVQAGGPDREYHLAAYDILTAALPRMSARAVLERRDLDPDDRALLKRRIAELDARMHETLDLIQRVVDARE